MSRRGKARQQKTKKALRRRQPRIAARHADYAIEQARWLVGQKRKEEAREVLEQQHRVTPKNVPLLQTLAGLYNDLGEYEAFRQACERLVTLEPDEPEFAVMRCLGQLLVDRPFSAYEGMVTFLERWPDHPFAEGVREQIEEIKSDLEGLSEEGDYPRGAGVEFGLLLEEARRALDSGEARRAVASLEALRADWPDFPPLANFLAHARACLGEYDEALAVCRGILNGAPDDASTLSNEAQILFMAGRIDESRRAAERLRELRPHDWNGCRFLAEAFSMFGDDEAVLAIFGHARDRGLLRNRTAQRARFYHCAASAEARQGNWKKAKSHWKEALKIDPECELADQNRRDADKPDAERHAPWSFRPGNWLPVAACQRIRDLVEEFMTGDVETIRPSDLRRLMEDFPQIEALLPALLDRGDGGTRSLAVDLALTVDTPATTEALGEFCRSPRGPDAMRVTAAYAVRQRGKLTGESQRMFIAGAWREIQIFDFDVTDEPLSPALSPRFQRRYEDAVESLKEGDGERAEELLQWVIARGTDLPGTQYNLAQAYALQGRRDESIALIRQVNQRWPDYLFGCAAMANMCTVESRYDEARRYLEPLRGKKLLHTTELTALSIAHLQLSHKQRDTDTAWSWLHAWRHFLPGHPHLANWEARLTRSSLLLRLWPGP